MKCPDCNGVIEGRKPFCPHCGRKFGGLFSSVSSPSRPSPFRPDSGDAERLITANPKDEEAQAAREVLQKAREARDQWARHAPMIRIATFSIIGAVIGSAFPGNKWILGAMIGLFFGLPRKKKS